MKGFRKISSVIIVFCLILSNNNYICAKNNNSLQEKASILKELNILKGNGTSLDLDSELNRSQAAAFIVRLLCQEEFINREKEKYSKSDFLDVNENQWYTSYISYCVEKGIIEGYSDNTFRPNDKLGEKAFLKLILTALGYKYKEDFTWSNVFQKAYGIGLVKDTKYINEYVEVTNYTRGMVVDTLYKALQLKDVNSKVRLIQKFIDKSIISKEKAKEYQLITDELETDIKSIRPIDLTSVEVIFNENVLEITPENVLIYKSNDTSQTLTIKDIKKNKLGNTFVIITNEQTMDESYTLLIDKVVDSDGNTSKNFAFEFTGFRPSEIKSDYFKISKIKSISNNTFYVYFTQPINDNALQASFYKFIKNEEQIVEGNNSNMIINKLSTADNGISIYLTNYIFKEEKLVQLSIDGNLSSLYGVRLNEGKGDIIKFKTCTNTNEPFSLESCLAINSRTIQLDFNKEVNPIIAQQIYSYYITDSNNDPIKIKKAVVVNDGERRGKIVRLIIEESIRVNKEYKLMVNNLSDITRQFNITEKQYSFIGHYYTPVDIEVEDIIPIDETTIIVYVDRPVDPDAAKMIVNYQISGVTNSSYVANPKAVYYNKKDDPQVIKLYLSKNNKLIENNVYKLRLMKSLRDNIGNYQSSIKTIEFTHNTSESMDTYISEAKVIGENTIKLSFSKEIALDIPNVLNTNYKLTYIDNGIEYNKIPIGANYIDAKAIILKFDVLDLEKEYKIYYKKLIDYGKNETDNLDGKYFTDIIMGK